MGKGRIINEEYGEKSNRKWSNPWALKELKLETPLPRLRVRLPPSEGSSWTLAAKHSTLNMNTPAPAAHCLESICPRDEIKDYDLQWELLEASMMDINNDVINYK